MFQLRDSFSTPFFRRCHAGLLLVACLRDYCLSALSGRPDRDRQLPDPRPKLEAPKNQKWLVLKLSKSWSLQKLERRLGGFCRYRFRKQAFWTMAAASSPILSNHLGRILVSTEDGQFFYFSRPPVGFGSNVSGCVYNVARLARVVESSGSKS
jgi:hypothetical protein